MASKAMLPLLLFTDGSVHINTKVGYGAYVCVNEGVCFDAQNSPLVHLKMFEQTSSTKLELQTLLWALEEMKVCGRPLIVYTDSQNIIGLPNRREGFEKNAYVTKQNKLHEHAFLYQAFYKLMDDVAFKLVKVKGHKHSCDKNAMDCYFTLVDRASRKGVRRMFTCKEK